MKSLQQFQILVLTYSRLFTELTGQDYDPVKRDWKEAKDFMEMKDWSSEYMEIRLREMMPQYFTDPFWKEQGFPAHGLFTQWNKFNPVQVKIKKEVKPAMLLCECGRTYAYGTTCEHLKV